MARAYETLQAPNCKPSLQVIPAPESCNPTTTSAPWAAAGTPGPPGAERDKLPLDRPRFSPCILPSAASSRLRGPRPHRRRPGHCRARRAPLPAPLPHRSAPRTAAAGSGQAAGLPPLSAGTPLGSLLRSPAPSPASYPPGPPREGVPLPIPGRSPPPARRRPPPGRGCCPARSQQPPRHPPPRTSLAITGGRRGLRTPETAESPLGPPPCRERGRERGRCEPPPAPRAAPPGPPGSFQHPRQAGSEGGREGGGGGEERKARRRGVPQPLPAPPRWEPLGEAGSHGGVLPSLPSPPSPSHPLWSPPRPARGLPPPPPGGEHPSFPPRVPLPASPQAHTAAGAGRGARSSQGKLPRSSPRPHRHPALGLPRPGRRGLHGPAAPQFPSPRRWKRPASPVPSSLGFHPPPAQVSPPELQPAMTSPHRQYFFLPPASCASRHYLFSCCPGLVCCTILSRHVCFMFHYTLCLVRLISFDLFLSRCPTAVYILNAP